MNSTHVRARVRETAADARDWRARARVSFDFIGGPGPNGAAITRARLDKMHLRAQYNINNVKEPFAQCAAAVDVRRVCFDLI